MHFRTEFHKLPLFALAVFVFASIALAQQPPESQEPPKPAGRGVPGIDSPGQDNQEQPSDWLPDTMPLTGLQTPTVGSAIYRHSYVVPGAQYSGSFQNQPVGSNSGDWYSNHYLGGNLSLVKSSRQSQFVLNDSGGAFFTTQSGAGSQGNGWYEQLALAESITGKRWQAQILDQFGYSPISAFGFGGGTGLGIPGVSGPLGPTVPGAGGSILPNQSIYAAQGPRYANLFAPQITFQLNSRGSITVLGAYGLLRFTEPGNVDVDSYLGGAGYNYQLTKADSIGFFYRFGSFHFIGQPQALGNQIINFAYSRRISRRLGLQLNVGPEITNYRIPIGNKTQSISGNGGVSLAYSFEKGSLSAAYLHALTGGSGILIGANTDQVTFSVNRSLTRVWNVQGQFGYASNRALTSQPGIQGGDYGSYFVGGGAGRPLGRNLDFSFAYTAQIQKATSTVCSGTGCSDTQTQNIFTVNLQWHTRPFVIE